MLRFIPFICIVAIISALYFGLLLKQQDTVHNTNNNLPNFSIAALNANDAPLTNASLPNKGLAIINFFASWCVPCVAELDELKQLSIQYSIPVYGIAWKDTPENITNWLEKHGNPYSRIAIDEDGTHTIPFAITGIPESLVIAPDGMMLEHIRMPITSEIISRIVALKDLQSIKAIESTDTEAAVFLSDLEQHSAQELFREIRCTVCDGESIAESRTKMAEAMRYYVTKRIDADDSKEAILSDLKTIYGQQILMRPPLNSGTYLLWLLPLLLLGSGTFLIMRLNNKVGQ